MPSAKEKSDAARSFWVASAVLVVCLAAVAVYGWYMLSDSGMSTIAVIALCIGVVLTLGLAIGLMSLLFYSNRQGFDDDIGR
ncbi:MAG TPA: hypothetical protein VN632_08810 [Stellaceae bacterium]|nr:hypothetical protein [Stellaceae bacterium]